MELSESVVYVSSQLIFWGEIAQEAGEKVLPKVSAKL